VPLRRPFESPRKVLGEDMPLLSCGYMSGDGARGKIQINVKSIPTKTPRTIDTKDEAHAKGGSGLDVLSIDMV
jgi:hypothetical protein